MEGFHRYQNPSVPDPQQVLVELAIVMSRGPMTSVKVAAADEARVEEFAGTLFMVMTYLTHPGGE